MSKVSIDEQACVGCGLCVNNCPDVFELTSNGIVAVKSFQDPKCDLAEVANLCPVSAIILGE
jgi:ferredoxin